MVLGYARIRLDLRSALLWPAILLHLGLGAWCVSKLVYSQKN
jgi:hypothetical protein